jgi:hypothetical protein
MLMTIIKTIEERETRIVHAAGEADGRTLCGLQVRTVRVTHDRDRSEVTCGDCQQALGS